MLDEGEKGQDDERCVAISHDDWITVSRDQIMMFKVSQFSHIY